MWHDMSGYSVEWERFYGMIHWLVHTVLGVGEVVYCS